MLNQHQKYKTENDSGFFSQLAAIHAFFPHDLCVITI